MGINTLSGNFQLPAQDQTGNLLPVRSEPKGVKQAAVNSFVQELNNEKSAKDPVKVKTDPASSRVDVTDKKTTKLAIEELNQNLEPLTQILQRKLRFQVDDVTGGTIISVIDKQTNETIRQIPPEEILTLSKRLHEINDQIDSAKGILFSKDV